MSKVFYDMTNALLNTHNMGSFRINENAADKSEHTHSFSMKGYKYYSDILLQVGRQSTYAHSLIMNTDM